MSNAAFPTIPPSLRQPGNIELDLDYGGDFSLQANGDIVIATDGPGTPVATRQRLERLLYTNPTRFDQYGNPISAPDDLFYPSYGAGLPGEVGTMFPNATATQASASGNLAALKSVILKALLTDPSVSPTPPPSVSLTIDAAQQVNIAISCTAVTGQAVTIPSLRITGA